MCQVAGTDSNADTFLCKGCNWQCKLNTMCKFRPGWCEKDALTYKSLAERWGKDRKLKTMWDGYSGQQRIDYMRERHTTPTGAQRKFDECKFSEESVDKRQFGEHEEDWWVPWRIFKAAGEREGKPLAQIEREWHAAIEDPEVECKWSRDQWLVPLYEGIKQSRGHVHENLGRTARTAVIGDQARLDDLRGKTDKVLDDFSDSMGGAARSLPGPRGPVSDAQISDPPAPQRLSGPCVFSSRARSCGT